jgi:hypothetical protein
MQHSVHVVSGGLLGNFQGMRQAPSKADADA